MSPCAWISTCTWISTGAWSSTSTWISTCTWISASAGLPTCTDLTASAVVASGFRITTGTPGVRAVESATITSAACGGVAPGATSFELTSAGVIRSAQRLTAREVTEILVFEADDELAATGYHEARKKRRPTDTMRQT